MTDEQIKTLTDYLKATSGPMRQIVKAGNVDLGGLIDLGRDVDLALQGLSDDEQINNPFAAGNGGSLPGVSDTITVGDFRTYLNLCRSILGIKAQNQSLIRKVFGVQNVG